MATTDGWFAENVTFFFVAVVILLRGGGRFVDFVSVLTAGMDASDVAAAREAGLGAVVVVAPGGLVALLFM